MVVEGESNVAVLRSTPEVIIFKVALYLMLSPVTGIGIRAVVNQH